MSMWVCGVKKNNSKVYGADNPKPLVDGARAHVAALLVVAGAALHKTAAEKEAAAKADGRNASASWARGGRLEAAQEAMALACRERMPPTLAKFISNEASRSRELEFSNF